MRRFTIRLDVETLRELAIDQLCYIIATIRVQLKNVIGSILCLAASIAFRAIVVTLGCELESVRRCLSHHSLVTLLALKLEGVEQVDE